MSKVENNDRAKRTLYVTGFNPKLMKKHLLEELFTQGGPVRDVTLFDTHAYILFQHVESVPYCLALFNEVELHGEKLRISPRRKTKDAFCHINYLMTVRKTLMNEFMKIPPLNLPPRLPPKKSLINIKRTQSVRKCKQASKKNKHSNISLQDQKTTGRVKKRRKLRNKLNKKKCK